MTLNRLLSTLYYLGMITLLTGIILHLSESNSAFALFTIGFIPVLGVRVYNLMIGRPENQRKHAIMVVSALMLGVAGWAILMGKSYWVVFIAIAAALDLYISFRRF